MSHAINRVHSKQPRNAKRSRRNFLMQRLSAKWGGLCEGVDRGAVAAFHNAQRTRVVGKRVIFKHAAQ